jgi:hypothetical protein
VEPLAQEQGYRLALARFRQEVDVAFLLVALRWLREACQLVVEHTQNAALAAAVVNFDRRLPAARDLRDVREHLRDYIQGSGKLQRDTTPPHRRVSMASLGSRTWLGHDELSHFIWAGKEIHLDDALPAAERLYRAMQEAIAPYVVRGSDGQEGIQLQVNSGKQPETTLHGLAS